ncbi:uncharacterized protein G2W53_008761 [Senna tora]|uniref:Uncharacterized protein n=1 Tax=Senna tora TaxID=362788 RepID=A0A834WWZ1_9FABA|nr:uncharacterized protein G2W53_008761 [Senna tora]
MRNEEQRDQGGRDTHTKIEKERFKSMRFLLDCVTCCGFGYGAPRSPVCITPSAFSRNLCDERNSLVSRPPPSRRRRRRKQRGRLYSTPDWKPSLGSICEDDVVPQRCDSVKSERGGKRKTADAAVHYRVNNIDYVFSAMLHVSRYLQRKLKQKRRYRKRRHLCYRIEHNIHVEIGLEVDDVQAQADAVGEALSVGGGDGGHELGGLGDSASDEVPSGGFGDEGDDEEEEEEGGDGGGDVESAPLGEDVGDGGEEGDAGGEEVEGGHAGGASLGGAHGLGGEDEGAEADAAGAEAGEEAEEEVGGVVRRESR